MIHKFIAVILILGNILVASQIEKIEIKGVEVPLVLQKEQRLPITSFQFVFKNSGTITDTKAGLAKLSAKMLNEGTKELGSIGFANELESRAIHISATAGTETFVIEIDVLKESMQEAFTYLHMLLSSPNLSEKALTKVKTTTIGALSRKESDYDYLAANTLKSLLFKDSPMQHPADGTIESVESITLKDIQAFLEAHLGLSNMIIVAGGDISVKEIETSIVKTFDILPKEGNNDTLLHVKTAAKAEEKVLKRETEQAYIYFGSPYNLRFNDKDVYKAKVATFILGSSGFGSRLMEEIRVKRGLAYSAYARNSFAKSSNYFNGYLQTKIESLNEAKDTVKEVIKTFTKKGVTQEELDQAKKFLLGSEPLRVETLSQKLSRTFMEYYKGEALGSSKDELDKIEALSLDELNAFIASHDEINDLSFAIVTQ